MYVVLYGRETLSLNKGKNIGLIREHGAEEKNDGQSDKTFFQHFPNIFLLNKT
jgi:hypothetical protein